MPEEKVDKKPESAEDLNKKMEEMQAAEDKKFMEDYKDVSMNDLISRGYVSHVVTISPEFKAKIRTLRKREELDIKRKISEYNGVQMYVLDEVNTDTLAACVIEINGVVMPEDPKKAREIIGNLGDILCMSLLDEYRNLNKALVILIKGSSANPFARRLLGQESV